MLTAAALALIAAPALGQTGRPSPEERAADRAAAFAQADADGDGALSPAEFETFHQLMKAKMAQRWFARADANGDGKVTAAELDAARPRGGCHHKGGEAPAQ
jgi:hypothetical protein